MDIKKIDAAKLSPEEQWFLRKTIVKLHLKGFTPNDISNMLDAKLRHVHSTIKKYKQNPEAVRQWMEVEYPSIKARAKNENADIYWGDEVGIQNKCNYVRGYAPKGQTPMTKISTEKKIRINMVSAINNQGKLRFMTYEGKMNQTRLIDFMKRLVKSNDRKVFLILDNLNVHHGKIAKAWAEKNKERIELFYFPSYWLCH